MSRLGDAIQCIMQAGGAKIAWIQTKDCHLSMDEIRSLARQSSLTWRLSQNLDHVGERWPPQLSPASVRNEHDVTGLRIVCTEPVRQSGYSRRGTRTQSPLARTDPFSAEHAEGRIDVSKLIGASTELQGTRISLAISIR